MITSGTSERRRALLRVVMGVLQVFAATFTLVLLLQTGVNRATIWAAVLSLGLTLTSKTLFRKEHNGETSDGQ